jgi:hypothetical protein
MIARLILIGRSTVLGTCVWQFQRNALCKHNPSGRVYLKVKEIRKLLSSFLSQLKMTKCVRIYFEDGRKNCQPQISAEDDWFPVAFYTASAVISANTDSFKRLCDCQWQ